MSTDAIIPTIESVQAEILTKQKEIRQCEAKLFQLGSKKKDVELIAKRRAEARKAKYKTKNGLTIEGLRKAGHKVRVSHIRYTEQPGVAILIPVPSYMRKVANFTSYGGATHIVITTPLSDSPDIAISSVCHSDDCFDYKMGVKQALDTIEQADADNLMSGLTIVEQAELDVLTV